MQTIRIWVFPLAAGAIALVALGTAVGYWLHAGDPNAQSASSPAAVQNVAAQQAPHRKPLYYQDPDGKPIYSAAPKMTADGRAFKAVFATATAKAEPAPPEKAGRILYYRNPMGLADTSPVPKKDSMGMDYVPVHEGEEGIVQVSAARMQMLGVRTATVEMRSSPARAIHAMGIVQADESKLAAVTMKFDGFVEKLFVARTGDVVRAGQPLARVWIDAPDTMMQRGPDVITRQVDYIVARQLHDPQAEAEATRNLREYGIPDSTIAEIARTGHSTRAVTITAPQAGIVLDKPAIEGMRFEIGAPLFKIADLSTVWVLADVQEQDLGAVQPGQSAHIAFVAYPGRAFEGKVDFVYPTMMTATRTGRVRIVFPNPAGLLRESMYATVTIDAAATSGPQVLVVPDSAIIDSGTQQVVLVARSGGRFEPRAVQIGARGDGTAQVLTGLKPGEQVVTSANFLIDAESNLRAALQSFVPGKKTGGGSP